MTSADLKASLLAAARGLQVQSRNWRRAEHPEALEYLDSELRQLRQQFQASLDQLRNALPPVVL